MCLTNYWKIFDKKANGEIQLSPSASLLAYYNKKKYIAGFQYQEAEIKLMELVSKKQVNQETIQSIPGQDGGTIGKNSLEFSKDENFLFFTQQTLYKEKITVNQQDIESNELIWAYNRTSNQTTLLQTDAFGELRRGKDQKVYIADGTNQLHYINTQNQSISVTPLIGGTNHETSGYLPSQSYRVATINQGDFSRKIGFKQYELTDHKSDVRAVFSDKQLAEIQSQVIVNKVELLSAMDYYPFGMQMKKRTIQSNNYRYGFNGMEKNDDNGNSYTTLFRQYESRIGRWLSIDSKYQLSFDKSVYSSMGNNPIYFIDPKGDVIYDRNDREITITNNNDGTITASYTNSYPEGYQPTAEEIELDVSFLRFLEAAYTDSEESKTKLMGINAPDVKYKLIVSDKIGLTETKENGGIGNVNRTYGKSFPDNGHTEEHTYDGVGYVFNPLDIESDNPNDYIIIDYNGFIIDNKKLKKLRIKQYKNSQNKPGNKKAYDEAEQQEIEQEKQELEVLNTKRQIPIEGKPSMFSRITTFVHEIGHFLRAKGSGKPDSEEYLSRKDQIKHMKESKSFKDVQ